jgi:hypothetical protein
MAMRMQHARRFPEGGDRRASARRSVRSRNRSRGKAGMGRAREDPIAPYLESTKQKGRQSLVSRLITLVCVFKGILKFGVYV